MFESNLTMAGQLPLFASSAADWPDLDQILDCPLQPTCEACTLAASNVAVVTAEIRLGVYCLSLCSLCIEAGRIPNLASLGEAARRVLAHCEHLDITLDQMAQARRGGGDR